MTRRCPLSARARWSTTLGAILLVLPLAALAAAAGSTPTPHLEYTSPMQGARYVRPGTGLILRFDQPLRPAAGTALPAVVATGSRTGVHAGRTVLADDGRTLVFKPQQAFAWGEEVAVTVGGAAAMRFTTSIAPAAPSAALVPDENAVADPVSRLLGSASLSSSTPGTLSDSIPPEYPNVVTTIYNPPAPGYLFMSNFGAHATAYLLIVDNGGTPIFYRAMPAMCTDFKLQPTGQLTYYDTHAGKFYALNEQYAIVDSFSCGGDVETDEHELRLLPNGHALLLGDDPEIVDMSAVVPFGDPTATVIGNIIQELDTDKNVVFEWRSWDHFQITDATHENLSASVIDYEHANALDVDHDGNLLLSSRHMDEITKIDHATGETIWRWGGKNNQFTQDDPEGFFSHQHAIRRLDDGDVTLFDNGDYRTPTTYSRAAEYDLDEVNKVATLTWEYRNTPDSYGNAMGYVQRLDNGNTLIGFGTGNPDAIEVDPDGNKIMEASLPAGESSYRTLRQVWNPDLAGVGPPPAARAAVTLSAGTPNPSRGTAAMDLGLAHATTVSLSILDVRGRVVQQLLDGAPRPAGVSRIAVDLAGYPAGVYFARAVTGEGTVSRRIVHLQ